MGFCRRQRLQTFPDSAAPSRGHLPGRARALRTRRPRNRRMRPGRWPTTLMGSTEPPNLISIGGPAGNLGKRADKRFALQPVPSLQIEFYFEKGESRSNGEGVPIQCGFRRRRKRQSGAIGENVPANVPPVRVQCHMQTVTQVCKPVLLVAKVYHSTGGAQGSTGRAGCAAEYAVARKSYSRSRIVAGPDGPVLATRERGLQAEPASIHNAREETV